MRVEDTHTDNGYPTGAELRDRVKARHRQGSAWRSLFIGTTALAIVVLAVLLVTIINQSFGLVAVQTTNPPDSLVLAYQEGRLLGAENTHSSEDDDELAVGITGDPLAIGFFGYAYYRANEGALKALSIDGVAPTAENVSGDRYPLARPLYIYTTAEILAEKPQVGAFTAFYLAHVGQEIADIGYFPADEALMAETRRVVAEALEEGGSLEDPNPASFSGDISVAGSSTLFPLTRRLADRFLADGYRGDLAIESVGSTAGLRRFCVQGNVDVASASRPISQLELEACRANGREPVAIGVGTDAMAIVISQENDFANDLSQEQLATLFTNASAWADVNPTWPEKPVRKFIPGADSGTLDFFAETIFDVELADLPKEALVDILAANISRGLGRRLERDQLFYDNRTVFENPVLFNQLCLGEEPPAACFLLPRTQEEVYALVQERVVKPKVVESWFLFDSIFNRADIVLEVQQKYPRATIESRSWFTPEFITKPQSSEPELAGVRTAFLGTLWVILVTIAFSFPLGVGAAVYLEEYADHTKWTNRIIQTNINNLAGVPSIIYGMLGLAVFVRALEILTSGAVFGLVDDSTTANGRTILSAGLTLGLLILPIIIISSQEAIRAVPGSLRQASFGLGATRWQTIWYHVLPNALPGILTGTILAVSRAVGETAPLVVVGASTFITVDPTGPFSKFTVLPIQIFQWTTRPQGVFRNIAGAAIIVLLALLLTLNATAVILRNRTSKRMSL